MSIRTFTLIDRDRLIDLCRYCVQLDQTRPSNLMTVQGHCHELVIRAISHGIDGACVSLFRPPVHAGTPERHIDLTNLRALEPWQQSVTYIIKEPLPFVDACFLPENVVGFNAPLIKDGEYIESVRHFWGGNFKTVKWIGTPFGVWFTKQGASSVYAQAELDRARELQARSDPIRELRSDLQDYEYPGWFSGRVSGFKWRPRDRPADSEGEIAWGRTSL